MIRRSVPSDSLVITLLAAILMADSIAGGNVPLSLFYGILATGYLTKFLCLMRRDYF